MLKLVAGRAGSGKSTFCLEKIKELAKTGKQCLLIVPEQSSFSFERSLSGALLGEEACAARVMSFKKQSRDIFSHCGGGALLRLKDAQRCTLVRRAAADVEGDITYFRRHRKNMSFFKMATDVIDEFKNAGVSPTHLEELARLADLGLTCAKLHELALIYGAYEAEVANKFYDDSSELYAAAERCKKSDLYSGKTVFYDGFSGFTEPEYALLAAVMEQCDDMYVTLCCDNVFSQEENAFYIAAKSGRRLIEMAKKQGIAVEKPLVLSEFPRFKSEGLLTAESFFAGGGSKGACVDGLYKIEAGDVYEEISCVADEIVYLARVKGFDYSQIAVIARDIGAYTAALRSVFGLYKIPYFCDFNEDLSHSPIWLFVKAALEMTQKIKTEPLLALLKTRLTSLSDDDIALLENYVFVWDISGEDWLCEFSKNPHGFDETDDLQKEEIAQIERARSKAVGWLLQFKKEADSKSCCDVIREVYRLLERSGALAKLEKTDDEQLRQAQRCLELLGELYELVDGEYMSAEELIETAEILAKSTEIGDIPRCFGQVAIGEADRMRTDNPRAVFVLGLCEGLFPKTSFDTKILTQSERDFLSENGVELAKTFDNSAAMERMFLYRAVTCAGERLYFGCPAADAKGSTLHVSSGVESFLAANGSLPPEAALDGCGGIVNAATARREYSLAVESGDVQTQELIESVGGREFCEDIKKAAAEPSYSVSDTAVMHALLTDRLRVSASKINMFYECRFSYFLNYIMKIRPIEKAAMSPLESGTFIHAVVENLMRRTEGRLCDFTEESLGEIAAEEAKKYVEQRLKDEISRTPRLRYIVSRLIEQTQRLAKQLRREQEQSSFEPTDFELEIGERGEVVPLVLETPDGKRIIAEGKVDRVDVFRKDGVGYLRIVDYKTGNKKFKLDEVMLGLNIQMLLYLFTLCKNAKERYGDVIPAGVLYMPADPPIPDEAEVGKAQRAYRMNGLVLEDIEVIKAMERECAGVFIPIKLKKDGTPSGGTLADLEEMGAISTKIDAIIIDMARTLYDGDIEAQPVVYKDFTPCKRCRYTSICRKDRIMRVRAGSESEDASGEEDGGQ
ncbi:MAG: PD-(D/E)XK nuclease family protein [Oscillospiraceae bacterium]